MQNSWPCEFQRLPSTLCKTTAIVLGTADQARSLNRQLPCVKLKQTVILAHDKQTVALLTANTDSYLGSQIMSRLSQHGVTDVDVVVVANGKEKCAKCITQWVCCTPYKAEAVCNPDEYSLATLQTAKKDLLIVECEGRLSWSMSS